MLRTTLVAFALAATALAVPSGGSCNSNQEQICCSSLIGLDCLINLLGTNCGGGTYCCDSGSSGLSLINIDALNCVSL
ncbi:hypothetical protein OIDMADRAFT_182936 [Aspergillus terreus]|uniref:Uncharacterized protein n=1 Tax=Aspergillus terreus TaxID=33178 RepID=A0A5M3ZA90_ASPTE|nr:hypothetical protein ATETN484_0012014100 [Aspergillus terreus]GFF19389.1 hypothetical protein OIDMADRAFT_182936 [Aspergillus terreus]